jgi:hypothetical protein
MRLTSQVKPRYRPKANGFYSYAIALHENIGAITAWRDGLPDQAQATHRRSSQRPARAIGYYQIGIT